MSVDMNLEIVESYFRMGGTDLRSPLQEYNATIHYRPDSDSLMNAKGLFDLRCVWCRFTCENEQGWGNIATVTVQNETEENMFSYWAYILIGNNKTGKTSFQRYLVCELCGKKLQRLRKNRLNNITHPRMPRDVTTLYTMNSSYQEIREDGGVVHFFRQHFEEGDICILSSLTKKPAIDDIREMIHHLRLRAYNVAAVFLSNGYYNRNAYEISALDWDERLWLDNPKKQSEKVIQSQIEGLAKEFAQLLVARATHH